MGNWHVKKQTAAGRNQGKWTVYRPDGLKLQSCEDKRTAQQIAFALRVATKALGGNWFAILQEGTK